MRDTIIKFILFSLISFLGGFLNEFLKDMNINLEYMIYFTIGWVSCMIFYY